MVGGLRCTIFMHRGVNFGFNSLGNCLLIHTWVRRIVPVPETPEHLLTMTMAPTNKGTRSLISSMSSVPNNIIGVGLGSMSSLISLVSAITLEDESSAADDGLCRTSTVSRGHGEATHQTLPMPTRKASNNYMGLNMPTRKASLYNISSKDNLRNATFENHLPSSILPNAKFDLTTEKCGSKKDLFPQVHKTSGSNSLIRPPLDLSSDIFKVLSPARCVTKPKKRMYGIKNMLGKHKKSSTPCSASPCLPKRRPSVYGKFDDIISQT